MKQVKFLMFACVLALFGVLNPPRAKAGEWNHKTILTFSAPVELPGIVLPPGTYVFELMDSDTNRNVVQVFDKDESRMYTTIQAVPAYRTEPPDKTVITFEKSKPGLPEEIRAWFHPGDNQGVEFIYPKFKPMQLASARPQGGSTR